MHSEAMHSDLWSAEGSIDTPHSAVDQGSERGEAGCHRASPSVMKRSTCLFIIPHSFTAQLGPYLKIKSPFASSKYFQPGGIKRFGLRKQSLAHDTTCLWIIVTFFFSCPLCAPFHRRNFLCARAISVMRRPLFFVTGSSLLHAARFWSVVKAEKVVR